MNRISTSNIQQQQLQKNHINDLMTTAAAGTGVVGDVDALLTPIQCAQSARMEARPERNLWRTDEIIDMLEIMQKLNAIELLNDKSIKSEKVFRNVESRMREHGYYKKTHVQIWTKWKFLKSTYTTSKRNGTLPSIPHRIYEMLHKMLFRGVNSDCNTSATSLDGDNSNASGGCNDGSGSGHIVISGVEGGYTNGKQTAGDSEEENGFGMAHPIFGFRLGLVKQEPADTGYETITNNGVTTDNDPLDDNNANSSHSSSAVNLQFQTEIKQEIEDNINSPSAPSPVAITPSLRLMEQINTPEILVRKRPVRITSIAPPATKPVCKVQIPSKMHTSGNENGNGNSPLPPLRIAPFAKVASANANAIQQPSTRPPPPLSMHPAAAAAAAARNARFNNCLIDSGIQRKLMKSNTAAIAQPQNMIPIKLPKEITVQTRTIAATAAVHSNMLRLKQVPTRNTPYSLRPDRMIPDLDSSTSPPALKQMQRQQYNPYQEVPTTSRQALNASLMTKKRKRRLELPSHDDTANSTTEHKVKMPRIYSTYSPDYTQDAYGVDDGTNEDYSNSMFDGAAAEQQQSQSFKPSKKEQEFFDSALKDLSTSLRQMQREMISDFFKKQMDLSRQEHEFQMRQDQLIMDAFEEQTRNIMKSAKKLLGLDLDNIKVGKDGKQDNRQQQQEIKESKFLESKMQKALLKKQLKAEQTQHILATENQATLRCAQAHEVNSEAELEDEYDENNQIAFRDDSYQQQHHNINHIYEENDNDKDEDDDDGEDDDNDDDDDDDDDDEGDDVDDNVDNDAYENTGNVEANEHDDAEIGSADDDDETDGEDEGDNDNNNIDNIADPIQLVSSELVED